MGRPDDDKDIGAAATMLSASDGSLDQTVPSDSFGRVDLTKETGGPTGAEVVIERGTTIGHYVVLDRLGSGTMGVVMSAIDPALDRKVAIKLVRSEKSGTTVGRQRLVREAQAMARLSHPNVMTVFEVGTYQERVFLAMEYVAGATLATWLAKGQTPREIVQAFLAAGQGLAAAHRAGIVHRDFKPSNVLVAKDGRVRVADFGLATSYETRRTTAPIEVPIAPASEMEMTSTGAILGTPAYMAPEQHRAQGADARADQFAFCVALYEALYRELPFEGTDYVVYAENVLAGRVREAPAKAQVSARIRKMLLRGLALDPNNRYPDMEALLAEVGRDPAALRRRVALGAGVAVTAIAVSVIAVRGRANEGDPCAGTEQPLAALWNAAAQQRLEQAFRASGAPDASDAAAHAAKLFDTKARSLRAARRDACLATAVRHEQSAGLLDPRMQCIDRQAGGLAALYDVLVDHPNASTIHKSIDAIAALPPTQQCSDRAALVAAVPLPAAIDLQVRVRALEKQLDRAQALDDTGNYQATLALTSQLAAEIDRINYAPLRARVHYLDAHALINLGRYQQAVDELRGVGEQAAAAQDDTQIAKAWLLLYVTTGFHLAQVAQARLLEPTVAAAVVRAGNPTELRGAFEGARGNIEIAAGEYAKAAEHFDKSAKLLEQALGPDHLKVASTLAGEANALEGAGRYADARALLDRALAIQVAVRGHDHPAVGTIHYRLGSLLDTLEKPEAALAEFQKAAAIDVKVLPPNSPLLGDCYVSMGVVLVRLDRAKEALDYQQKALAMFEADLPNSARKLPIALLDLGNSYRALKRYAEAIRTYQRGIELAKQGADENQVADIAQNMALAYLYSGDSKRARASWQQALAMREAKLGPDHPEVAKSLFMLAEMSRGAGDYKAALAQFDRGIAILDHLKGPKLPLVYEAMAVRGQAKRQMHRYADAIADFEHARGGLVEHHLAGEAADARLQLAETLWQQGAKTHKQAIAEARGALAELEAVKPPDAEAIKGAREWLAQHHAK